MTTFDYQTIDAAKGWTVAWMTLTLLGALFLLGGRSTRGNAATNLGLLGLILTVPSQILGIQAAFGHLVTASDFKTATDLGPVFAAIRFAGWALLILALIVAKTPNRERTASVNPPSTSSVPPAQIPRTSLPTMAPGQSDTASVSIGPSIALLIARVRTAKVPKLSTHTGIFVVGTVAVFAACFVTAGAMPGGATVLYVLVGLGLASAAVVSFRRQVMSVPATRGDGD